MMKIINIFLVLLVLFISVSAVSAEGNFTALQNEINSSTSNIDITQDYIYDNGTDYGLNCGILINKSDFTIDGHGYTIDGSNQARIFDINGGNITISNLIFINGNIDEDLFRAEQNKASYPYSHCLPCCTGNDGLLDSGLGRSSMTIRTKVINSVEL